MNTILSYDPVSILCIGMGWFPQTPGGLNRYVYELTSHLAENGDQVELYGVGLPHNHSDTLVQLTNLAESSHSLPQRLWLVRKTFLSANRQVTKPDAINLHFALYSLPVALSLPNDVPITFTFHGPWALESKQEGSNPVGVWFKEWIERRVYQRCDRFIVLSHAFGQILHEHYYITWDKIHIIPGGVDTQQFYQTLTKQQAREQLGWPQDRFILFTPRRLVHRMGIDVLLNALHNVRAKHPEVWLAVAGKGPLRESLDRQVKELGLSDQVQLLGYLPDEQLPVAYQAADLTVVPSQHLEGFGLIVLESLASGTPVLCTPVGGMPEILNDFSPALIVESTEAAAIASKLTAILDGNLPLPTSTDCSNYASENFNWVKIAQRVRQVLLMPKA